VLAASGPAAGQVARIANDEPEIRVRAGGRAGTCDALVFTPDGGALLAAGEDKLVHRWAVGPDRLRPDGPLSWNTFRERRGSIYALAVHPDPDRPRVAVGGYGKLNADVAVFDPRFGQPAGAVSPLAAPGYERGDYAAAGAAVWALAFRPDGRELAIGDDEGSVWTCPLESGSPVTGRTVRVVAGFDAPTAESRVVWVGYLPGGRLLYAKRDGGVYAVGAAEPLFRWGMGAVARVVVSGDGKWLAAGPMIETEAGSAVEVRSLPDGKTLRKVEFPRHRFPDSIALDADGSRLAVGVAEYPPGRAAFAVEPVGRIEVYDLAGQVPRKTAEAPGLIDQVAFHPDGQRLATADSLDHGTALWRLDGDTLRMLDRDRGQGRQAWAVGVSADGKTLCFKDARNPSPAHPNDRGAGDWVAFDLGPDGRGWAGRPKEPPAPPENDRAGWSIVFDPTDEYRWSAVEPGGRHQPLMDDPAAPTGQLLDRLRDDKPRCYTFLPPPAGSVKGAVRLAVGHHWGASVFDLAPGRPPRRVRKLVGHAGPVVAVAPTANGLGLVTAGRDGVIAFWNLAPFPAQDVLGAAFADENGAVVVKAVDPGSPADEAGLSVGDTVHRLMAGGVARDIPRADWFDLLRDPRPASELAFWITNARHETPTPTKTLCLHRPAARFVPLRNGEWVLYTYRQCYYDGSANGDRFVEWLRPKTLADLGGKPPRPGWFVPDVLPVDQFRRFLHRPEKVTEVVTRLAREPGRPLLPDLFPPAVTVATNADSVRDGQEVAVTVTVVPRPRADGKANPVDRVELWLNGHHRVGLKTFPGMRWEVGKPVEVTFPVPAAALGAGPNVLQAVGIGSDNPADAAGSPKSPPVRVVLTTGRPAGRRLFGLVAGVGAFHGLADDLASVPRDVALMREVWAGLKGAGGYTEANVEAVQDGKVTKARVVDRIRQVGRAAGPDDVFVLFLGGHGTLHPARDPASPARPRWFYVIPQGDDETPLTKGGRPPAEVQLAAFLRDDELADALAGVNCRKVVLLDCCHAGAAGPAVAAGRAVAARNPDGGLRPHGFGPVVIAASAANQSAWGAEAGNGLFTAQVAAALGEKFAEADADRDGKLTVAEFFRAVRAGTEREAARQAKAANRPIAQTPELTPPPDDAHDFPLAARRP
jgi:WD40 repeat protein